MLRDTPSACPPGTSIGPPKLYVPLVPHPVTGAGTNGPNPGRGGTPAHAELRGGHAGPKPVGIVCPLGPPIAAPTGTPHIPACELAPHAPPQVMGIANGLPVYAAIVLFLLRCYFRSSSVYTCGRLLPGATAPSCCKSLNLAE